MGFKSILETVALLYKDVRGGVIAVKEKYKKWRRHAKIDKAFEEKDPAKSAADLNDMFD